MAVEKHPTTFVHASGSLILHRHDATTPEEGELSRCAMIG
jgi:hypothetical protein